ncbi:hypothetical protein M434DRAFT_17645 [Hypoxylon sp. CO27-5]|nr:hypothetical protein M434DRAFT_17645 [Hypoxylon sp. CO27-5]
MNCLHKMVLNGKYIKAKLLVYLLLLAYYQFTIRNWVLLVNTLFPYKVYVLKLSHISKEKVYGWADDNKNTGTPHLLPNVGSQASLRLPAVTCVLGLRKRVAAALYLHMPDSSS